MGSCKASGKYGFGLVVLLAGLVLLGGNLGLIPEHVYNVIMRWPMILVAISLISFINRDWLAGLILLTIGSYFMMPHLVDDFSMREIWKYWPVLLIIIGVAILRGKRKKNAPLHYHSNNDDYIEEITIFGGNVTRIDSKNLKGGEITSIFGGSEINLIDAELSDDGATIEMTAIFGGVKLIVPRQWNIKIEVTSILGGFTDKRVPGGEGVDTSKILVIKGETIFGGGELVSY
ncbi:LiaI-LiaF-like domain-containing protein [Alkalitalea saponilacus]|uniref:Predicted membrane protein n=1 Tax=Alkalitalea saponilacus TaxID=889453 RepID=A0A1T5CE17_9BACT|nr:DUF5668 domain-containing protein [Alkalitalea saponilacus]ASB49831.1 hypothetical protein CDL62_12140 [Alkalitalea saponilacus]SKB57581.1 Predicted membrane protein [Alkalitalea saponilacus]